jgi:uncharacterized membrane protein
MLGLYHEVTIWHSVKNRRKNKMNVNFNYSKTLAGEGAVLLLLSLVPTIGWVLGIVGIVLLLKAMKELSYYYEDESIYSNAWKGLKYYIVALIAAAVAVSVGVIIFATTTGLFAGAPVVWTLGLAGGIAAILAGLAVAFVFYLLAALNLKKTFSTLAKKSGENNLETAGTLLLIGSALTIAFGVGLLIIFVAWIFATIGFFSMKPKEYQPYNGSTDGYTQPPTSPDQAMANQIKTAK